MRALSLALVLFLSLSSTAQKAKTYQLASPDGNNVIKIEAGDKLQWSLTNGSQEILAPSSISLRLSTGEVLGDKARIVSAKTVSVSSSFEAVNYKKKQVEDHYRQLTLDCKGGYGVIFR